MTSSESFVGPAYQVRTEDDPRDAQLKELKARLNRLERQVIVAMSNESLVCRYHGQDWGFLGWEHGIPRCDSCKQPYRRTQLLVVAGGTVPNVA